MANVKTITLEQLDRLGVDEQNILYWDGKPLKTEERIVLSFWVNIAVIVSAGSTLIVAVFEALKFFGYGTK